MFFLSEERALLERYLPGLDGELARRPLAELEGEGSPIFDLFRAAGGPRLLIPRALGGGGAPPVDLVRIHRALGARSPSLALGASMHAFALGPLVEYHRVTNDLGLLLAHIAERRAILSSAWAEGNTSVSIQAAQMVARPTERGDEYLVSGVKRPCSLSHVMDLVSATAVIPDGRRVIMLAPADSPGIERKPFWKAPVLAALGNNEVTFRDVRVPAPCVVFPNTSERLDAVEERAIALFELVASASYLGVASALVERVIAQNRGNPTERVALCTDLELGMAALEGVAHDLGRDVLPDDAMARSLFVRYGVQHILERVSMGAAELLGGIAFSQSTEVMQLMSCTRLLAFHPPGRLPMVPVLSAFVSGKLQPISD